MGRTLSAKQVLTLKRRTIRPGGIWADCVGEIDRTGVVFFWGNSGNGKTSAVASFCKELTQFGRVLYLPLEEGLGGTTQDAIRRYRLDECGRKFQYNATMTFAEMDEALSKPRSWDFVVIDSFQYTQMSYKGVYRLQGAPSQQTAHLRQPCRRQAPGRTRGDEDHVRCVAENLGRGAQGVQQRSLHRAEGGMHDLRKGGQTLLGRENTKQKMI